MLTVEQASERLDAWIRELRNPDNKQARGNLLNRDGGRCCMGILCDISPEMTRERNTGGPSPYYRSPYYRLVTSTQNPLINIYDKFPPYQIMNALGMSDKGFPLDGKTWAIPESLISIVRTKIADENFSAEPHFLGGQYPTLATFNDTIKLNFAQIADIIELNKSRLLEYVAKH